MNWKDILQSIVTVVVAFVASTGFWTFLQKRLDKKNNNDKLLIGLAHDRIIHLGRTYLERGYITTDEYENLNDYLYVPYAEKGGNGSAKRVMEEVRKLPIR